MGKRIARTHELVRPKRVAFLDDSPGHLVDKRQIGPRDLPRRGARRLVDQHNFRAEGRHHAGALHGIAARHDGNERIALDPADNGQAGAHIAGGQLNHGLAGRQHAASLRLFDHHPGGAVLLGKSRV